MLIKSVEPIHCPPVAISGLGRAEAVCRYIGDVRSGWQEAGGAVVLLAVWRAALGGAGLPRATREFGRAADGVSQRHTRAAKGLVAAPCTSG